MNIFVTSPSAKLSALWLDDKRKNSQIRESVQLLSNALGNPEGCYKKTHHNHPCSKWVAADPRNFNWLYEHCYWLGYYWHNENIEETENLHGSLRVLLGPLSEYAAEWLMTELTPTRFQNSARNGDYNVDFTDRPDVFTSYRDYLSYRWSNTDKKATWERGQRPDWYTA
jgi:hypothetical protein